MSNCACSLSWFTGGAKPDKSRKARFNQLPTEIIMPIKIAPKQSVHLVASSQITLDQLNKAVAQAVGIAGCRGCGLLGIDLHFHGGDPIFEKFRVEGIDSAIVRAGPQGI
jgi:hypothetical protein